MTTTAFSDAELLAQARQGDETAFAELYVRHEPAARRLANSYARACDPDDLVNESFERVLKALRKGLGPTEAFRAYLFVTLRRLAADRIVWSQDDPYDEVPEPVRAEAHAPELDPDDRALIVSAYESLPDRWQAVLWQTAVEGHQPRDLAPALGMSPNAAAALAYRAREKLRQAYLQAHLQTAPRPQCEPHRSRLGAYVRDGLGARDRGTTEGHLDTCSPCRGLVAELADVNRLLVRSFVPIFAAAGQVAAALAAVTTATTGAVAGGAVGGALRGAAGIGRRAWSKGRSNPGAAMGVVGAILLAAMIAGALIVASNDQVALPGAARPPAGEAASPSAPASPPGDTEPPEVPFVVPPPVLAEPIASSDDAPPTAEEPAPGPGMSPTTPPSRRPPPSIRTDDPSPSPTTPTEPPVVPPTEPPTTPPVTHPPTTAPPPPEPTQPFLVVVWIEASAQLRITLDNPSGQRTDFLSLNVDVQGGAVINGTPAGCDLAVSLVWTASCGLAPVDPGDSAVVTVPVFVTGPGQSSRVKMCDGGILSLGCTGNLLRNIVTSLL
jgi:RNA polymerase sigma factor (sigma-70 family)